MRDDRVPSDTKRRKDEHDDHTAAVAAVACTTLHCTVLHCTIPSGRIGVGRWL
jgi:hypothetical protein